MNRRTNPTVARWGAPVAFLVAATIAILLVRSGLENGSPEPVAAPATTAATTTEPGETTPPPATTEDDPQTEPDETTDTNGDAGAEFYEIQSGDTLAVVADRHDTTVEQLLVLNPDVDPVALTIGQRIRVK